MADGRVPRSVRALKPLSVVVLLLAIVTAAWLWATSIESREVTRRIIGHASLTWRDEVTSVSWVKILGGVGALAVGTALAAALRAISWLAQRERS